MLQNPTGAIDTLDGLSFRMHQSQRNSFGLRAYYCVSGDRLLARKQPNYPTDDSALKDIRELAACWGFCDIYDHQVRVVSPSTRSRCTPPSGENRNPRVIRDSREALLACGRIPPMRNAYTFSSSPACTVKVGTSAMHTSNETRHK